MEEATETPENGQKLWETKYKFRKDMLPMFVGEPFGKKVCVAYTLSIH
jgi:gamma-tubulin complex component 3